MLMRATTLEMSMTVSSGVPACGHFAFVDGTVRDYAGRGLRISE